jgi:oligogalacturonide lyase
VRQIANVRGTTLNCDETFSVTTLNATDPTGRVQAPPPRVMLPQRERMFGDKLKAGLPLTPDEEYAATKEDGLSARIATQGSMAFAFTNLKTGAALTTGYQYAWLNHLQFSPTDPNLLLYCHEGTWHEVDRVWVIRTDGTGQRLLHARTMDMEIAGHEFWSHDGSTVWFDLQLPRSHDFWLGGVNVATGRETRYHLERDWWGVHFNLSRDGKLFASDGGDPTQVAFSQNGQWINLLRPQGDGAMMAREKLVNMAKHNYVTGRGGVEPNVTFTPDGKWVVFTGNFEGKNQVYAVEVVKAR